MYGLKMFYVVFLVICIPSLAYSLTCHRCFGNGFCHDPEHSDFPEGIRNATCGSTSYFSSDASEDSFATDIEKMLNENFKREFLNTSTRDTVLEQHCLTATVHEPHDSYTLRTCISRAVPSEGTYPTLCEFIRDHIEHQNYYNGSLSCRQCDDGDFCNEHVLGEGAGLANKNSAYVHVGSIFIVTLVIAVLLSVVL